MQTKAQAALWLEINSITKRQLPPPPARFNVLDLAPIDRLEVRALRELRQKAAAGDIDAHILEELVARMGRVIEAYKSRFSPSQLL